jgi:hypothetical protein
VHFISGYGEKRLSNPAKTAWTGPQGSRNRCILNSRFVMAGERLKKTETLCAGMKTKGNISMIMNCQEEEERKTGIIDPHHARQEYDQERLISRNGRDKIAVTVVKRCPGFANHY